MKSLLKLLLAVVAALAVVAIGLAIAVAVIFKPSDYQPLLAASVEKATGRKLVMDGDLGLKLFPCCSVTLGHTSLGNPPGFPAGEFASVDSAALGLKIWPLLTRRDVEVGAVHLQGLNANLIVRADGVANWEFESGGEAPAGAGSESGKGGKLAIEGIEIQGGRIAYRDEQDGSDYLVQDLELKTGNVTPGKPFDFKTSARLTDASDGTTGTMSLSAKATLDQDPSRLTMSDPQMSLSASGKAIPAKSLKAKLGAAELAIESGQDTRFDFKHLEGEFTLPGFESPAGDVEGSFIAGDGRISSGASTEMTLPALTIDITITGKTIPGNTITAKVKAQGLSADMDKVRGSMESMTADVTGLGASLQVAGQGRVSDSDADMTGTLKLDPVSPRSLLAVLNEPEPKTRDPKALTRLSGTANWTLKKDLAALGKLDFQLDQTHLSGSAGIRNFDRPVTAFDLQLDALDLDRYLEPEAKDSGRADRKTAGEATGIPVDVIRDLRLDGSIRVGQLGFSKMKMSAVSARVRAADGKLRLDPLSAKLYDGDYRGAVTIDATGRKAGVSLDQQITALQVGDALKDIYQTGKLTGALTGRITATGAGNASDEILKSLSGNVALNLADGAYLGTDLWHEIRSARARLKGDAPPPAPANPRTPLTALELAGKITDGVLRNDKLLAEVPFIRLGGGGALNLVGKTMDYALQAQVYKTPEFDDGSKLSDLTGLTIPLTVKGAMDKPKVGVDFKNLAKSVATQKVKERLLKKLGLDEPKEGNAPTGDAAGTGTPAAQPPKPEKPRDALKRSLRDLLEKQP